ncbi:SigE family RNA polymerase sigma factor [Streptomyces phaeochromogenes]|uniref:SigE family RNA polymerase sigma factor n=1 Tax=Streptomyces phaeochromogenes TaxID=1923 RepID=UPI00386F2CD8|nr:SigE family RNA polymerase sigma factor [Streptomyces phaeochromogenes]
MPSPTDDMSFEQYVRERHTELRHTAHRLVADPWEAEDLLQDALLSTVRSWESVKDKSLADLYVRRTLINQRTDLWRRKRLQEFPTDQVPDVWPHDDTELDANRRLLLDAFAVLSPRQQLIVVLRYFEERNTLETARAAYVRPGTVKATLHRSLAKLRTELQGHDAIQYGL